MRNLWAVHRAWEDLLLASWWRFSFWITPAYMRGNAKIAATARQRTPSGPPAPRSPEQLRELVTTKAAALGLSQVGFAVYDPRWTFADDACEHETGTVIVCLLEEDYAAEQRAPSVHHERRTMAQYAEQAEMVVALARALQELGYRACAHDAVGPMMYIPYAIEAGLGQLGLNGQLLTPLAGARCTIMAVTTDAQIAAGAPRDFGIPAICDACKACVRRCPVGAIPARRAEHRGVLKAKINTARCIATVVQADGCAVCSKVCPIQRYGLAAVHEHFARTGKVLGRGSEELEGFRWPLDGRYYPPGEKPRIDSRVFMHPNGLDFDPNTLTAPIVKRGEAS